VVVVNAGNSIEHALDWAQNRIEESPLTVEHSGHKDPERLGDQQHQSEEQQNLKPTVGCHQNFSGRSKAYTRYADVNALIASMMNDSICMASPSLHAIAKFGITDREREKCDRNYHPQQVLHKNSLTLFRPPNSSVV
jgi:hypothetical protein